MIRLQFQEGDNINKFNDAVKVAMNAHIDHFDKELKKIRTGRAHTSLVEDIMVECYGNRMRLKDLSTITTPDAQSIVIQPWDHNNLSDIEKSLRQTDLGITPHNDGSIIRIKIAPMSTDQRTQLVKNLNKRLEECKVAIRNIRKDFNNIIRDKEKDKSISEDTGKRLQTALQKVTDELILKADTMSTKKENDIKSV